MFAGETFFGERQGTRNAAGLFDRLINTSKFQVAFQTPNKRMPLGQPISFSFRSSKDGYVNIVELEPNGNVQVLFPNKRAVQNQIKAYEAKRIPEDIGGFHFVAKEPVGKSRIIALVTRMPFNLFERQAGRVIDAFKMLTEADYEELEKDVARSVGTVYSDATEATGKIGDFGATEIILEVVKER